MQELNDLKLIIKIINGHELLYGHNKICYPQGDRVQIVIYHFFVSFSFHSLSGYKCMNIFYSHFTLISD
jgi:hypothetical protein